VLKKPEGAPDAVVGNSEVARYAITRLSMNLGRYESMKDGPRFRFVIGRRSFAAA
jgi:hypothetical protein